jgi:hypothetical protein
MAHISFENSFREFLSSLPLIVEFDDNSQSFTDLDFILKIGDVSFALELKEKKQKYNLLDWEGVHVPEEHFMLIDELSVRKIALQGAGAGLLVRDSVRNKLFFFSMIDLLLMPHKKRFNRPMKLGHNETLKDKWSLDLRNGQECVDFDAVMNVICCYANSIPALKQTSSCLNVYQGETIIQGGITRTLDYLNKDVAEK